MKNTVLLIIFSTLVFFSCTEIENFINEVVIINHADSSYVEKDNDVFEEKSISNNKVEDWEVYGNSKYDENKTFDKNEGSYQLKKTSSSWKTTDRISSKKKYKVIPGDTYQVNIKSYTDTWPPPTLEVFGEYFTYKNESIFNSENSYISNSEVNNWENNKLIIRVPDDKKIDSISLKILMLPKYGVDGNIWIDDVSFTKYENRNNMTKKREFNGSKVKIDDSGNMSVKRNNVFEDFFPICIYGDNQRKDWSIYSKQGFNCYIWSSDWKQVKKAKEAGLLSGIQVGQYVIGGKWIPKSNDERLEHLSILIDEIKNNDLIDEVVFYYIDNEFYRIDEHINKVIEVINKNDVTENGDRMHPIYMLNGMYGVARKYNDLIDMTGTYVALDRTNNHSIENFEILNYTENQKIPVVMAQINRGVGDNFRPVLFGAIARGAKGIGFWRDGGSGVDITKESWWDDFPIIVNEIQQMMPLIKETQFTNWSAICENNKLIYGTRTYKDKAYMIIANPTEFIINASFTIENLSYNISSIHDYFNNSVIAIPNDNVFTLSINAHGTKVIRLD